MKKLFIYLIGILLVCFGMPLIGVHQFKDTSAQIVEEQSVNNVANEIVNEYDYKEYSLIKLLHSSSGEVEEIKLDDYIYGVVSAEMPANFEIEALKAQAIVARTYTIYKIKERKKT